jgi:hypothetical protein
MYFPQEGMKEQDSKLGTSSTDAAYVYTNTHSHHPQAAENSRNSPSIFPWRSSTRIIIHITFTKPTTATT